MAVLDSLLEFSDAQALASKSSGVVTKSTNVADFAAAKTDAWGSSLNQDLDNMVLNVGVAAALVGAGAAVVVSLVSKAANASISSGATVHSTITIPAVTAAGTHYALKIDKNTAFNRYVGVLYTASGAKLTSATFDSWLGLDAEKRD